MKEIKLKITGIRPLVLHNGLMADPTNPFTIAIKKMAGLVQQQAYILSFIDIFLLLTVLFGSLVVCAFAISKPQSGVGGGGGH